MYTFMRTPSSMPRAMQGQALPPPPPPQPTHENVFCDGCRVGPIIGTRWKCLNCDNYDLCSACEALSLHTATHLFAKISVPLPGAFCASARMTHALLSTDLYQEASTRMATPPALSSPAPVQPPVAFLLPVMCACMRVYGAGFGLKAGSKDVSVLTGIRIAGKVENLILEYDVSLSFHNCEASAVEAVFRYSGGDIFACHAFVVKIDGRAIRSKVKEKREALASYDDAISEGRTAAVATREPGAVFQIALGSLPPNARCVVTLSIVQQVPLDPDTNEPHIDFPWTKTQDGAPMPASLDLSFTALGSDVGVSSPSSHRLSVTKSLNGSVARVQLADTSTGEKLQIRLSQAPSVPCVLVEKSLVGGGTAVAISWVPQTEVEQDDVFTEVILLVDRSGSMCGDRIRHTKNALQLLLRSLPQKCRFNLVSFGDGFTPLFPHGPVPYNAESFQAASVAVSAMEADMGGTVLLAPLRASLEQSISPDYCRQIIVITDGDVDNSAACIQAVKQIADDAPLRVFALGIGSNCSRDLVEGLAEAGRGSCEFVTDDAIASQVARIAARLLRPALKRVSFDWSALSPKRVVPHHARKGVFRGEKVISIAVLHKKHRPQGAKIPITVEFFGSRPARKYVVSVEDPPVLGESLHRLMATMYAHENPKSSSALRLALRHGVVSEQTALVAIDETARELFDVGPMKRIVEERGGGSSSFLGGFKGSSSFLGGMQSGSANLFSASMGNWSPQSSHFQQPTPQGGFSFLAYDGGVQQQQQNQGASNGLHTLISLQLFDGSWRLDDVLARSLGKSFSSISTLPFSCSVEEWATALACAALETKFLAEQVQWSLLAQKAHRFLGGAQRAHSLIEVAKKYI